PKCKAPQYRATARRLGFRLRQRRLDAPAQRQRRGVLHIGGSDRLAHLAIGGKLRRAGRASRDMLFDLARMARVEFAVHQGVKKDFGLVASHLGCSSSAVHAVRSMARARARRDITVPTGAPTALAISRYERLLISRSTNVSRNGSASADTSRRTVAASRVRSICASGVSCASFHSGVCSALSGTSSIGPVGELARRANSARQTLRRIANSHGFIAGPRYPSKCFSARK